MALKYAPTMVIGLEDGSGNDEMAKVLEDVRFWLSEYYRQVCPIVRFGMADKQKLTDLTEKIGESVGSNLTDGLRRWLETIAEARRLEEVRGSGFEIVGVERLNRHQRSKCWRERRHQPADAVRSMLFLPQRTKQHLPEEKAHQHAPSRWLRRICLCSEALSLQAPRGTPTKGCCVGRTTGECDPRIQACW